jgi:hypothetical protein
VTVSIAARVRRVLHGHSDRALVHAVDDAGLEYKIEVPHEAVRDVSPDRDHVLVLTWSLEAAARAAAPVEPPSASTPSSSPSAVDQAFMELMAGSRSSTPDTASARDATKGLAELLGIKRT